MPSLYRDRREGAARLAKAFKGIPLSNPIILAIPRGGVVTGFVLAREIGAELDIVVSRKLGSPGQPELAMGAVMHDGTVFMNEEVVLYMGASRGYVEEETKHQVDEAKRRLQVYRGDRAYPRLQGRSVIIVDDGVATGATMITAVRWVKSQGAKEVIAATPVAPPETFVKLKKEADRVVCPELPEPFFAIGQFYEEFPPTTDEEVVDLLRERHGDSRGK
jgi:predicted phosphoribosyltransferase